MRIPLVAVSFLISIAFGSACGASAEVGSTSKQLPGGLVVYRGLKGDKQALVVESLDGRIAQTYRYSSTSFAVSQGGGAVAFVASIGGRHKAVRTRTGHPGRPRPIRGRNTSLTGRCTTSWITAKAQLA